MKTTKKHIWIPALLSLSVIGVLPGCGAPAAGAGNGSEVPVQLIKLGQLSDSGISGKIIPDQDIKVVSKVSGKVAAVSVEEGAKVKKGDVLIQLETDDLSKQAQQAESGLSAAQAKLADTRAGARAQEIDGLNSAVAQAQAAAQTASAAMQQAEAGFKLATDTYNKLRNQYDSSSAVTREDMDRGTFEYEKAKAAYEQAQAGEKSAAAAAQAARAKLDLAKAGPTENTLKALAAEVNRLTAVLDLANTAVANATITSPIDGTVVKRMVSVGEMAQAGAQIVSIVNMDQVQVELSVAENQIGKLKTGSAVEVKVPNVPDKTFQGKITFVSPVSNANSTTFPVKVTVDNKDGLLFAGMVAEVRLSGSADAKLELPKSAVIKKDDKTYVVKSDNQTAHLVEIKTEEKNQDWVYVLPNKELQASQQVVVNPGANITEGTKLKAE
ncbi:efflux RND transporter periplasmic adaptor subunit [Paenibacillus allorhizosphaerae]|uniref:Multidrug resistance protein MdtA n=1 Tax=Paenibacillus allorhizosphaerae TaxID=2849866 RepID=A0ABM8VQ67_9BACL|nr:efflux RND transporter periplasmic adaptor subunit [Paenibacillus allorhizosphaerae]CAG7653858.1 Multidrug resistance protein MdtA [Paenibacillus allorhizosphaerae]